MIKICEKCCNQFDLSSRNFDATVCEGCFEGDNYFLPDIEYPEEKRFKESRFELDVSNINEPLDIIIKFIEFEHLLNDEIREEAKQQNKYMAVIFREFDITDAIKELMKNNCIDLKVSYFFTNYLLETVPNYEDQRKHKNVVFSID